MSEKEEARLSLSERLDLAWRCQSSSDEAAQALVRKLSEMPAVSVFCGSDDVNMMAELTGDFWDDPRVDVDSYMGFCPSFPIAIAAGGFSPGRPALGVNVTNALVLLAEMLLDHAMGRMHRKDVYACTRMCLKQYLEALDAVSHLEGVEKEEFSAWRRAFLEGCDGDTPLAQVLVAIIEQYMCGWWDLDKISFILRCMGGFALQKELDLDETAEQARRFRLALNSIGIGEQWKELPQAPTGHPNPEEYYLHLMDSYNPRLPVPGGKLKARTLRDQIFMPDRSFDPQELRSAVELLPCPVLQDAFGKALSDCDPRKAMEAVDDAVMNIYMMWVAPYARPEGPEWYRNSLVNFTGED